MKRRHFLSAVFGVAASGVASSSAANQVEEVAQTKPTRRVLAPAKAKGFEPIGRGYFVVTHPTRYRVPVGPNNNSMLSVIDAQTGLLRHFGTPIHNIHSVHRPIRNNPDGLTFLLGQDMQSSVQIVNRLFDPVSTIDLQGATVRGHAIDYKNGVLLPITRIKEVGVSRSDPENGFLAYVSLDGKELGRYPLEGFGPHQIIDCGEYFAVSIYGDAPMGLGATDDFYTFQSEGGPDLLRYNTWNPGVCFLDKDTLEVKRFVSLPSIAVAVHLSVDAHGKVLVMSCNERNCFGSKTGVWPYAKRDDVLLLSTEVHRRIYEEPIPLYEIDPDSGNVRAFDRSPAVMRGASGMAHDPETKYTVGIFGASQTVVVRDPKGRDKFFDSLALGISDPRGVCSITGSGLFAISGQTDRIAILDPTRPERALHHYNVALGEQSHLHWFAA